MILDAALWLWSMNGDQGQYILQLFGVQST
jgi:hypothetical protein